MRKQSVSTDDVVNKPDDFIRAFDQQAEQIAQLQHQLDWFKRQVFGSKSEKRHIDPNPDQLGLLSKNGETGQQPEQKQTVSAYQRGTGKKDRGDSVNDSGLRFDDSVEVKELRIIPNELKGPDADQYEIISEHKTFRLAQRPSSFFVICYIEPVLKRKPDQQLIHHQSPSGIFDKSIVDISFFSGHAD